MSAGKFIVEPSELTQTASDLRQLADQFGGGDGIGSGANFGDSTLTAAAARFASAARAAWDDHRAVIVELGERLDLTARIYLEADGSPTSLGPAAATAVAPRLR